jgi:AraC-like DNA-binding protein
MKDNSETGIESVRRALAAAIAQYARVEGPLQTTYPPLRLFRRDSASEPNACFYEPALAVIAQGAKAVMLAGETFVYDEAKYLLTSVDLPVTARVIHASPARPYLSVSLKLDLKLAGELMADLGEPDGAAAGPALATAEISAPLLDAVLRLVRLLESPRDIPVLAPLIEREITYRLLSGPQGARLGHLARQGSRSQAVARAITWLKTHYHRPLRIEELAQHSGMSVSSLHHHFKAVTNMSPLQFQKQLRLQEARRLMLTGADAAVAGHKVGYESPSHFSRDYSRVYGAPPLRDVEAMRQRFDPAAMAV